MVAKVISGKTIRGVLTYNENKVSEGSATCLSAMGFRHEADKLSFTQKLETFTSYQEKNERSQVNAVHISLNFDKSDELDADKLNLIAIEYMNKIGFGLQPFLVYQHNDAAHPHVHIVTTNIRRDGSRIALHNIGRNQSEKARKEIEAEYHLVKATGRRMANEFLKPMDLAAAHYGKSETKRSISNIVNTVTRSYKFTSIHELNAALKQYNVIADRGSEGSMVRAKNGLRYSIIDSKGQPIGIPIKASSIYGKPTLSFLMDKFAVNELLRSPYKEALKNLIDTELKHQQSFESFVRNLTNKNVFPVIRQNTEGKIYGITFVDNNSKCVFNGSDIGKQYSAKGILDRLGKVSQNGKIEIPTIGTAKRHSKLELPLSSGSFENTNQTKDTNLLSSLVGAHLDKSDVDSNLKKKRRKKKGRSL
jgi:hypothetical protein